jgi:thiol-disulfide isomerase/thioredoxin
MVQPQHVSFRSLAESARHGLRMRLAWGLLSLSFGCTSPPPSKAPSPKTLGEVVSSEPTEESAPPAELMERASASETPGARRPWIGVELRKHEDGVRLVYVLPTGPAALAGLRVGDTVLRVGEQSVADVLDVGLGLETVGVLGSAAVKVRRDGVERLFRVEPRAMPSRQELMSAIYVGQPAPSISSLVALQGTVVPSLERLRGHVVLIEFWASFCTACRALTSELNRWNSEREVLGQRLLGVTMDPIEVARDATGYFEMEYSVHLDETGEVTRAYRGTALPTVFLVDRRGIVRDIVVGLDFERLERMYHLAGELLAEPTDAVAPVAPTR